MHWYALSCSADCCELVDSQSGHELLRRVWWKFNPSSYCRLIFRSINQLNLFHWQPYSSCHNRAGIKDTLSLPQSHYSQDVLQERTCHSQRYPWNGVKVLIMQQRPQGPLMCQWGHRLGTTDLHLINASWNYQSQFLFVRDWRCHVVISYTTWFWCLKPSLE